ncbi:HAMP domain-containing protein [Planosporangium thailandense]|uniref:histidine kinase n=2 Tax=Planosporangium thailandense TaxID=765197 RepID=A0ABX0Y5M5_9ACTN|nr:ATP-binding protein [Planosporangium thailandense]NJC72702.1 HAMP domain-containing protein [Planosporangium thailandense]
MIGAGGLAVGFALGGIVLIYALEYALQRGVDSDALATAHGVAELVNVRALPQPVPVSGGQIVQVVDAKHRVRSASIGADRLVPLLRPDELAAARAGEARTVDGSRAGVAGPLRVVAVKAGPPDDPQTVLVARPVASMRESVNVVRTALLIAYPLLIAVLALFAWRVVGAALRPVEELRAGAETITGGDSSDRLPVPDSRDEIHRLAVTLNDMLDRLARSRTRQRAFVADAAHELRSPLANMRTELEVAQRIGDPAAVEDLLADVERLSRLVDDLLLLARADEAPGLVRAEPVELGALLRETAERYGAARVPVTVADGPPQWTSGDPQALRHVVTNLVDNAVRHATSRVTLAVVPDGFTVIDDGPGIPPADRERVFERFTRLDDARARDAGGAGLGLAIVQELVHRHGGTVTLADAHPGIRARVRLHILPGPPPP